jgi:hypothetical protein
MRAEQTDDPHFKFEHPLDVTPMTIDWTRRRRSLDRDFRSEAQVELKGHAAELSEFFLTLNASIRPVFCSGNSSAGW